MKNCPTTRHICDRLVISNSVTFTSGNLVVNLPDGTYVNGEKYCIVLAQAIPEATTITAPVVITIGTNLTTYPLVNCDSTAVRASSMNTRTRYSIKVRTDISTGVFMYLGKLSCHRCTESAPSLPIPTPTTPPTNALAAKDDKAN